VEKKWWLSKTLWLNAAIALVNIMEPTREFFVSMGWGTEQIVGATVFLNALVRVFGTESKIERKVL
jgi:hypothetical protein